MIVKAVPVVVRGVRRQEGFQPVPRSSGQDTSSLWDCGGVADGWGACPGFPE
jgi:hypothetical protein